MRFSSHGPVLGQLFVEINGMQRPLTQEGLDKLSAILRDRKQLVIRKAIWRAEYPFSTIHWTSGSAKVDEKLPPDVFIEEIVFTQINQMATRVLHQKAKLPPFALKFGANTMTLSGFYKNSQKFTTHAALASVRLYPDGTFTPRVSTPSMITCKAPQFF